MLIAGTEMHVVTFIFVVLEVIMLFFQVAFYLSRPEDRGRLWYLILLLLLLFYNIASGLLPDQQIGLPIYLQNIIAYGSGFIMASFFPYYFYRAFHLERLRFHALYGIYLFLILPYVVVFVIVYSINKDLLWARKYGLIIPFFYAISLLAAITRAIFDKYQQSRLTDVKEIIGVYLAVAPWVCLPLVTYLDSGQPIEASLTNGGFLVITVLYIRSTVKKYRAEYREFQELGQKLDSKVKERTAKLEFRYRQKVLRKTQKTFTARLDELAGKYNLTNQEKNIVSLIVEGKTYSEIAGTLFISRRTVSKHAENIYKKTDVRNKIQLIKKLNLS